ncbi:FecR family protein [Sphingobacterium lactis]|uniref:FecR family protein n=1 Tax=Sphingobacterium lactis TaxID=797291 RepID=UPI003F81502A
MINQDRIILAELAASMAKGHTLSKIEEEQLSQLLIKYPESRDIILNMIEDQQVVLDFNPQSTNVEQEWDDFHHLIEDNGQEERKIYPWKRIVSIAALLLSIGIGSAVWWKNNQEPSYLIKTNQFGQHTDILPGTSFAKLEVVGDGSYELNESFNSVEGKSGELSYGQKLKRKEGSENQIHRLNIPKRSYYSLVLSDGSKVWLNSESELEYLASFSTKERRVKLKGEGYFEVAKDANRPFIVETDLMEVRAVGTAFSVKSYTEEPKVILTEGKIEVTSNKAKIALVAGQKVELQGNHLKMDKSENDEEALAIKDGYFNFNEKNIQEILDDIRRWYGVDLVIKRPLGAKKYMGGIDRNVTLGELCVLLKKLTNFDYVIEDEKLIIQ